MFFTAHCKPSESWSMSNEQELGKHHCFNCHWMQLKEFMFLYWIAVWSKSMFNPNRSWTLDLHAPNWLRVSRRTATAIVTSFQEFSFSVLRSFLQGYWEGLHQFAPQFLRKSLWNKLISIHNNAAYSLLACNRFELLSLNDNMAIWYTFVAFVFSWKSILVILSLYVFLFHKNGI